MLPVALASLLLFLLFLLLLLKLQGLCNTVLTAAMNRSLVSNLLWLNSFGFLCVCPIFLGIYRKVDGVGRPKFESRSRKKTECGGWSDWNLNRVWAGWCGEGRQRHSEHGATVMMHEPTFMNREAPWTTPQNVHPNPCSHCLCLRTPSQRDLDPTSVP